MRCACEFDVFGLNSSICLVGKASCLVGRGGEYAPQVGFGWSKGVSFDILAKYF
jgi:hypothetical protein